MTPPCELIAGGVFVDGYPRKVFNAARSHQVLPVKNSVRPRPRRSTQGEIKMAAIQLRLGAFSPPHATLPPTDSAPLPKKKYAPGATHTRIKIGNIMPYSGPASSYGVIG